MALSSSSPTYSLLETHHKNREEGWKKKRKKQNVQLWPTLMSWPLCDLTFEVDWWERCCCSLMVFKPPRCGFDLLTHLSCAAGSERENCVEKSPVLVFDLCWWRAKLSRLWSLAAALWLSWSKYQTSFRRRRVAWEAASSRRSVVVPECTRLANSRRAAEM